MKLTIRFLSAIILQNSDHFLWFRFSHVLFLSQMFLQLFAAGLQLKIINLHTFHAQILYFYVQNSNNLNINMQRDNTFVILFINLENTLFWSCTLLTSIIFFLNPIVPRESKWQCSTMPTASYHSASYSGVFRF